jgi:DNA invertase Pin-like site-specific DNA recombinase
MLDFARLLDLARTGHWTIVALDLGVDTSSPAGEMLANVIMAFAQYERRLISQRTTAALKAAKARGITVGNPHLGKTPPHIRRHIPHLYAYGHGRSAIARLLNTTNTPTAQGAPRWTPASVAAVLNAVE